MSLHCCLSVHCRRRFPCLFIVVSSKKLTDVIVVYVGCNAVMWMRHTVIKHNYLYCNKGQSNLAKGDISQRHIRHSTQHTVIFTVAKLVLAGAFGPLVLGERGRAGGWAMVTFHPFLLVDYNWQLIWSCIGPLFYQRQCHGCLKIAKMANFSLFPPPVCI